MSNTPASYLGGARVKNCGPETGHTDWCLCGFPQPLYENTEVVHSVGIVWKEWVTLHEAKNCENGNLIFLWKMELCPQQVNWLFVKSETQNKERSRIY